MAPIKKTYSRKGTELKQNLSNDEKQIEKENVDPFDTLLSSPLKHEVEFKPLSFWSDKSKAGKNYLKKKKLMLFESSDSDVPFSPDKRKKRYKQKPLEVRNKQWESKDHSFDFITSSFLSIDAPNKINKIMKERSMIYNNLTGSTLRGQNDSFFVTKNRNFNYISCQKTVGQSGVHSSIKKESYNGILKIQNKVNQRALNLDETKSSEHLDLNIGNRNSLILNYHQTPFFKRDESIHENYININSQFLNLVDCISKTYLEENVNCSGNSFFWDHEEESVCSSLINTSDKYDVFSQENQRKNNNTEFNVFVEDVSKMENEEEETYNLSDSFAENTITDLTTSISDLSLSKTLRNEKISVDDIHNKNSGSEKDIQLSSYPSPVKDGGRCSSSKELTNDDFRNVTLRRRFNKKNSNEEVSSHKVESFLERDNRFHQIKTNLNITETSCSSNLNESQENYLDVSEMPSIMTFKEEISLDSSRCLSSICPVFESTRIILDDECKVQEKNNRELTIVNLNNTTANLENTIALKPGKKWLRSFSVLRQLQEGNICHYGVPERGVKGKMFQHFVQEMIEMQNEIPHRSMPTSGLTTSSKTLTNETEKNASYDSSMDESFAFQSALELQTTHYKDIQNTSALLDLSVGSAVMNNKTMMNHTVKVILYDSSLEKPSSFRSALGLEVNNSFNEAADVTLGEDSVHEENLKISARDFILAQCGQEDVLPFEEYFNERTLKDCKKIGEGVYGEVFMCNSDTVIKVIPIEGEDKVNGESQKKFEEILSEVVIAMKLSNLREGEKHRTSGFSEMKRCWCVIGKYPDYLLKLWNEYDVSGSGSENDSPVMFKSDQLYIILELANGGKDLESFVFSSAAQSLSILIQTAYSLAVAEKAFEFEHRDLHWGNLLIAPTKDMFTSVVLDEIEYKIPTKGVKVSIIDFTLSRMSYEGCCIFNDLSLDPSFFVSQGDYQFDIYRMMQRELGNDWSLFKPKNNLYWLHYVIDKMLKMVRYKSKNVQGHRKYMNELKILESVILEYKDCSDFVLGQELV